jgi:TRAP-type C4-dicarboxylate transport system substrate-binding protein
MFRKFVSKHLSKYMAGFAAAALVTGAADVAGAATTLKVGTIAPQDSSWGKEFKHFAKDVSDDTNGELTLDFQWNGQAGDERLMVQKIRSGQLDAAALTALGLAETGVTDILTFELPGLFTTWAKLDTARDAMKDEFTKMFEAKGFTILGWGDVGAAKNMSVNVGEIRHPADLRGKGVFFYAGDPITPKFYAAIGGITPKQLSINEVLPALTGNAINVVTAPPLGAEQLQWSSRITDINTETLFFVIGGVLASSARLASLPPNLRAVVIKRGAESADRLTKTIRNNDAQSFARMKTSKHTYELNDAERQEWRAVFVKVSKELRGSVFTPAIFDKVVQLAGNPLAQ